MPAVQRYKELRLGQLRAFCACVRYKSFSAAARALQISHPVVWQQVRALERDFGVSLLQRRGRQLEPTEDGCTLFELASSIVASMDSVHQAFEDRRNTQPRTLVVAGSASVFIQDMARLVVDFCRQHPRIELTLFGHQNEVIEEMVATGQADTAVMPHGAPTTRNPRLVSEVLCRHRWYLFMPRRHPLAKKRRLSAADFVRYPLILADPDNPWRKQVDEVLRQAGILDQFQVVLQVNNSLAARRYASLGLGLTLTPYSPQGPNFPNLCCRPLDHLFPGEHLVALWRRGATSRPQARLFIDFARRYLEDE